jgi:hypothetical protein
VDLISESTRTARVTHRCQDCQRAITPGETYRRQALRDGGDFWTWTSCAHCTVIATWLFTHRRDLLGDGLVVSDLFGDLHHDLHLSPLRDLLRNGYRRDGELVDTAAVSVMMNGAMRVTG